MNDDFRIELEKQERQGPICPHCDTEVRRIWYKELRAVFGKQTVYFCSSCRKVLGISNRKGFWMG